MPLAGARTLAPPDPSVIRLFEPEHAPKSDTSDRKLTAEIPSVFIRQVDGRQDREGHNAPLLLGSHRPGEPDLRLRRTGVWAFPAVQV